MKKNKSRFLGFFLFAILTGPPAGPPAFAQAPEFLVPISEPEKAIAAANNPYFLKKETYFAKQYRIVTVNTKLLLTSERIKISLFDGLSAVLEVKSVDVHPEGLSITWNGRFIEPSISVDDLVSGGMPLVEAETLLPHVNSLNIFAAEVSFDEKTRLKYQYNFARFDKFRDSNQPALYDVGFLLEGIIFPGTYELRPLASDPNYHVLIEWDPDKVFTKPIESDANTTAVESTGNKAKRQRYRDFLNALGPDPRPPDIHKARRP